MCCGLDRILIVTPEFPPQKGGAALSCYRLAQGMCQKYGLEVHVVVPTFTLGNLREPEVVYCNLENSFTVHVANIPFQIRGHRHSWSASGLGKLPLVFKVLQGLCNQLRPNILHCFTCYPYGTISGLIASQLNIPLVTSIRGSDITANVFLPNIRSELITTFHLSKYVCGVASDCTNLASTIAYTEDKKKFCTIPNGVDIKEINMLAKKSNYDQRHFKSCAKNDIVFGTSGIFRPKKGLDTLLNAFKELSTEHDNIKLAIIGPTENVADVDLLQTHFLQHQIVYTGYLDRADCIAAMKNIDVFILPSIFEGCANAMLEAIALGIPVISSRVGGAVDLLPEDTQFFEPFDHVVLAMLMGRFMDKIIRQRTAKKQAIKLRSHDDELSDWVNLYKLATMS